MTGMLTEITVTIGRSVELSILSKATVWVAIGLLAARMAQRAQASTRHLLLAAALVGPLAIPVAYVAIPPIAIPLTIAAGATAAGAETSDVTLSAKHQELVGGGLIAGAVAFALPGTRAVVMALWIGGALVLILPAIRARWRLARVRRSSQPWSRVRPLASALAAEAGVSRRVDVQLHEQILTPMTCGTWRPAILLPSDAPRWSDGALRRALVHEIEHVRRGDWAVHGLAHVACALYWFHPLVWMARRRLALEAEQACDDAVLQDAEQTEYAAQLVDLARRISGALDRPTLAMASRSDLSTRVLAILDGNRRRGRLRRAPAGVAIIVAVIAAAAIAPVRAVGRPIGPVAASAQQVDPEDAAQAAAEGWLKIVDEGRYEASWQQAASVFKSAVTEERWTGMVTGVRKPLGKLVSRRVKSRKYTETMPGAPDGQYVVIEFDTVFENKASAVETATPMRDTDSTWRVAGYFIR